MRPADRASNTVVEILAFAVFVRSTRSVRLTPAGELLLGYARTILHLTEDARLRLSGAHGVGRLRVGAAEDLSGWLPNILRAFRYDHPDVSIEVEIGIGTSLFALVDAQALDLVIGGVCEKPAWGLRLWTQPLVWAFASDVAVPDPLPLALFPAPCPYREAALRVLASTPLRWHIACTSASLAGVRAIATAGMAVTPLPANAITAGLRILGENDRLPSLPAVHYLLKMQQDHHRQVVATFSEYCQRAFTSDGAGHSRKPAPPLRS